MLIKGNFTQLDGLARHIEETMTKVSQEMDTWRTEAGATSLDWLDQAGGAFGEVNDAWQQMSAAQQAVLAALRHGVNVANNELQTALQSAAMRVRSTAL
ncbi:hypothetical protein LZG04_14525 [Saccharothrix sp. S26]|uniref:hypothetical protein n=1 Tax=Saccharothrix sp. S26 TaxID=2907215 RepID=UPI001F36EAB7|nr:hypothetical protein [Saccharothrix sp. S26]MCE6996010.1 hypothetical protein [Saccharothrix sp. S26]